MDKSKAAQELGKIGGKAKGKIKARGDSEYYRNLVKQRKYRPVKDEKPSK